MMYEQPHKLNINERTIPYYQTYMSLRAAWKREGKERPYSASRGWGLGGVYIQSQPRSKVVDDFVSEAFNSFGRSKSMASGSLGSLATTVGGVMYMHSFTGVQHG